MHILKLSLFSLFLWFTNLHANNLALPCAGCHVSKELVASSTIPSIKNLDRDYFVQAFKEYKNGERENYLMRIISNGYTDQEINILADYYEKKE